MRGSTPRSRTLDSCFIRAGNMSKSISSHGRNGYSRDELNGSSSRSHSYRQEANVSARMPEKTKKNKGDSALGTLLKLRQASRRKLPTEMGDGTYRVVEKRPGFRQDLRTISFAGKYSGY